MNNSSNPQLPLRNCTSYYCKIVNKEKLSSLILLLREHSENSIYILLICIVVYTRCRVYRY